ncbi:hypothetical protein MUA26_07550 [Staphylococcus sp. IVB6246]|uniref:hypothetical protein n=1 Tax=Staphylococcus sp. IVB6246 TaxID=2989772 RepID=UPI0021D0A843|nr:hypothetical protein [Staphylococcus sp. IVB6246]UXR68996.1 hypothetical protein MUA26_07550 [Staphylococcus sp. IVB6246]
MDLVTIDYLELKRLITIEVRYKEEIAQLEDELQDVKIELNELKRKGYECE